MVHTVFLPLSIHTAKTNATWINVKQREIHIIIVSTQDLPITECVSLSLGIKRIDASLINTGLEAEMFVGVIIWRLTVTVC